MNYGMLAYGTAGLNYSDELAVLIPYRKNSLNPPPEIIALSQNRLDGVG